MVKGVTKEVYDILKSNVELTAMQVFLIMCKNKLDCGAKDLLAKLYNGEIGFSYESVERSLRKLREQNEDLRDSGYNKRKNKYEQLVKEEVIDNEFFDKAKSDLGAHHIGFNYKVKNGDIFAS